MCVSFGHYVFQIDNSPLHKDVSEASSQLGDRQHGITWSASRKTGGSEETRYIS